VDLPVYELEHFLFFLYNKFGKKQEIVNAYNSFAGQRAACSGNLTGSIK
jgi:hypothetical protein